MANMKNILILTTMCTMMYMATAKINDHDNWRIDLTTEKSTVATSSSPTTNVNDLKWDTELCKKNACHQPKPDGNGGITKICNTDGTWNNFIATSNTTNTNAKRDLSRLSKRTLLAAPNSNSVLILSTTNGIESTVAASLGLTVVVVTPAQWATMTQSDYASYRAIILGDPTCGSVSAVAAAEANVNVWSPVVKGNILIDGTDPSFHATFGSNSAGALALTKDSLQYVAGNPTLTGAYISLSCYFAGTSADTTVNVLSGFGTFTARGANTCDGMQHIVNPQPSTPLAPLTDANLQGWLCSVHEAITHFPSTFTPFAVYNDPIIGANTPYILIRSANCCAGLYSGSACCDGNNVEFCVNQQEIYSNTCGGNVPHCQNVHFGPNNGDLVINGLIVQSVVCNV